MSLKANSRNSRTDLGWGIRGPWGVLSEGMSICFFKSVILVVGHYWDKNPRVETLRAVGHKGPKYGGMKWRWWSRMTYNMGSGEGVNKFCLKAPNPVCPTLTLYQHFLSWLSVKLYPCFKVTCTGLFEWHLGAPAVTTKWPWGIICAFRPCSLVQSSCKKKKNFLWMS